MSHVRRLQEIEVYANAYVRVFDDAVEFASGRTGTYVRILDPHGLPGVIVIALDGDHVCLVKTFRYPIGRSQWAFPRGFGQDADPLRTAAAELHEEVGGTAASFELIGELTPDSGLLGTSVAVVIARDVTVDEQTVTDTDEVETVRWVARSELFEAITTDGPADGLTLAALALYDELTRNGPRS